MGAKMSDRYKLLEQCAFPTCEEPHDPRWGWYCDGHGAATEEEYDKRLVGIREGIKTLRAALAAEKARADRAEASQEMMALGAEALAEERDALRAQLEAVQEQLDACCEQCQEACKHSRALGTKTEGGSDE
jgi:hypothetical protein